MRILLAAATLALALAFLPAPAAAAGAVCVPPGTLNQLCVGTVGGRLCAWTNSPNPMQACLPDVAVGGPVCVPPGTLNQLCVGFASDGSVCAWLYGGPVYSFVCVSPTGRVTSCSNSLYSVLYGPGMHCLGEPLP
ncbi:MAG: hypothetical protein QOI63_211 [Thermoplasmata archaeon]|jgi:hypothetical protein|nr:hypothetical protein [Thermoplasmata archaeon]